MPFIGNQPAEAFSSFQKQDFTTSATTSYTLDHPVANGNEIALFINFVRQEPTAAYTASGTSLTLTSATTSSDDMYCVYLGKAVQTVNPPNSSVGNSQLDVSAINSQTAETSIAGGDEVLIYDTSASALRKMTRTNFVSGVGGDNKPIFYGELASSQTVTRSTDTKVTGMTNNEVDSNTAFDGTTFTVPSGQGGTYYLKGIVTGDFATAGQDGEEVRAYIYKNGSSIKEARILKNTGGANYADLRRVTVIAETIVSLSASDTVELYARMTDFNNSGDGDVVSGQSSLGGYKLIT